jgi:peptidyl-prolyl cis-trans isomerase SurA
MPDKTMKHRLLRQRLAGVAFAACLAIGFAAPTVANAQVVVVANGSPITELDIQQRTKLLATSNPKPPGRQEVINELIDDRLKIARARFYSLEISDEEVDAAFASMAQRQRATLPQFMQVLERSGISASAVKARIRAQMTWDRLVRGKFGQSLTIGDTDIAEALKARNEADKDAVGHLYTLYPVIVLVPAGTREAAIGGKRQEAENLRSRFNTCTEGLALARSLREVAVREPVNRSSADLAPQLREILDGMQIGRLTAPEVTPQGLQMFALCSKKESKAESSVKRQVREEIYSKRYEAEAKKFMDEIRKSAMIEYRK